MFLRDPPRSQYDWNFKIAGIPVRVHPFFWLMALLMGSRAGDMMPIMIWIGVVFVSILVHELGHAFAMRYYGCAPRVVLYSFGGMAIPEQDFGRMASSYTARGNRTKAQIIISGAGPAAGFALAGVVIALLYLLGRSFPFFGATLGRGPMPSELPLLYLINDLLFVNIFWGLINLLPIYPLDGGHISRELFLALHPRDAIRQSLILSIAAAAGVALYGYTQLGSVFMALFFGYLAYTSYQQLQSFTGGYRSGRW